MAIQFAKRLIAEPDYQSSVRRLCREYKIPEAYMLDPRNPIPARSTATREAIAKNRKGVGFGALENGGEYFEIPLLLDRRYLDGQQGYQILMPDYQPVPNAIIERLGTHNLAYKTGLPVFTNATTVPYRSSAEHKTPVQPLVIKQIRGIFNLQLIWPENRNEAVFWDVETITGLPGYVAYEVPRLSVPLPFIYMHGILVTDHRRATYSATLMANKVEDEQEHWLDAIRLLAYSSGPIWHYGSGETATLRVLGERYGWPEGINLKDIEERRYNLAEIIGRHLNFGANQRLGLKALERRFGYDRSRYDASPSRLGSALSDVLRGNMHSRHTRFRYNYCDCAGLAHIVWAIEDILFSDQSSTILRK